MQRIYIGTYTSHGSRGIYTTLLDSGTGRLQPAALAAESPSPTFLAPHPCRNVLYAVGESRVDGRRTGSVVRAFTIAAASGTLELLNEQPSRGVGPCHVSVHPSGKVLFAAHYAGGSVSSFSLQETGEILPASSAIQHEAFSAVNPERQEAAHAHSSYTLPATDNVLVADLGADAVYNYRLELPSGTLMPGSPPLFSSRPGSGPRHMAFLSVEGRQLVYLIHELDGTISVLESDRNGSLTELQVVSTLPEDFAGENTTAEVAVHPGGCFLYGSNRGHDSIVVFEIGSQTGLLSPVQRISSGGKHPRHFSIDPSGSFLVAANRDSDNLVVFQIDADTGELTETPEQIEVSRPVCVRFVS